MTKNKILTSNNAFLSVQFGGLVDAQGNPLQHEVLEGLPLGTSDQSQTGELAVKTIIIADRSSGATMSNGFLIPPYDEIDYTYYGSTNNIETATYKNGGNVVKVLTFTYVGSGSANNDKTLTIIATNS